MNYPAYTVDAMLATGYIGHYLQVAAGFNATLGVMPLVPLDCDYLQVATSPGPDCDVPNGWTGERFGAMTLGGFVLSEHDEDGARFIWDVTP